MSIIGFARSQRPTPSGQSEPTPKQDRLDLSKLDAMLENLKQIENQLSKQDSELQQEARHDQPPLSTSGHASGTPKETDYGGRMEASLSSDDMEEALGVERDRAELSATDVKSIADIVQQTRKLLERNKQKPDEYGSDTRDKGASKSPPSDKLGFVRLMEAIIPAEVLVIHSILVSLAAETMTVDQLTDGASPSDTTAFLQRSQSVIHFPREDFHWYIATAGFLVALSWIIFISMRKGDLQKGESLDFWDCLNGLLPASALIAWMLLVPGSFFDAVWPGVDMFPRTMLGLGLAALIGLAFVWIPRPD